MAEDGISQVKTESRFKAFVSYSHADKAAAQKLHRKLEAYRLPKHLCSISEGAAGGDVPSDGRIGAIFRDREDLPAAEDLSASVKAALSASEALVVLCSPDAQKSPWVAREIELFREIHPDRPVLAAILRGEPDEAFPEPLKQGREPLAADLRPEGDGPRLGFLKVVAGIAGVPLDVLVNRDAQRRVRRVTAITVAAVAAMVVMALMTTFALQARDEAVLANELARAQSRNTEELNRFFVEDFRERLLSHGRIDLAKEFYPRVLKFCRDQNELTGNIDDGPTDCAQVMYIMGSDYLKEGEFSSADEYYQTAHAWTKRRWQDDPKNLDQILAHAESENRLGLLLVERGQFGAAVEQFRRAESLLQTDYVPEALTRKWIQQVAYVQGNLGSNLLRIDVDLRTILPHIQAAVNANDLLLKMRPDDNSVLYDQIFQLQWLADSQYRLKLKNDAMVTTARYLEMIEVLTKSEPENMLWREQKMQIYLRHAELILREGGIDEASRYAVMASKQADILVRWDPENSRWQSYKVKIDAFLKGEL